MSSPLDAKEKERLLQTRDEFEDYCERVGNTPEEGSQDWNKLARAWIAWLPYREQHYR